MDGSPLVLVVVRTSVDVCEENAADFASFGKFGQPNVILESVFFLL